LTVAAIRVDPAALRAAARRIDGIAETFSGAEAPAVAVTPVQATTAAVSAVHSATAATNTAMGARLRSTASAMTTGGSAFATTERLATDAVAAVPGSE
jgi:hypothetical protein